MVGNLTNMLYGDYRRAKAHATRHFLSAYYGRELRHRHKRRTWRRVLRRLVIVQ